MPIQKWIRAKLRRLVPVVPVLALFGSSVALESAPAQADTTVYSTLNYPWSNATYVDANYDWGYSTCPSSDTNCMTFYGYLNGVKYGEADPWSYYLRNCTSYVAWQLAQYGVPTGDIMGLGNGGDWYTNAQKKNLSVGTTPKVNAAVVVPSTWSNGVEMNPGHVAFVRSVNSDGTITVQEYNHDGAGDGDTWTGLPSSRGFSEYVYFGNYMTNPPSGNGGGYHYQPFAADFNGDGLGDIGLRDTSNGVFYIKHGPTFGDQVTYAWAAGTNYTPVVADFNGDGYADIGLRDSANGTFYIKHGPSFNDQITYAWGPGAGTNYEAFAGDFNRDGYADIGLFNTSNGVFYIKHGPTFSDQITYTWVKGTNYHVFIGDFNGDGYADIGLYNSSNGAFYIKHGPTFGDQVMYPWAAGTNYQPFAADFNGDGLGDIGLRNGNNGVFYIKHGTSFGDQITYPWVSG